MSSRRDGRGARRWAGWSAAAVVAAVALVTTLPAPPDVADDPPRSTVEPVSLTVLECPLGARGAVLRATSAAVPVGGAGRGDVVVDQPGEDPARMPSPRRGVLTTVPVERAPVEVRGTGPAARGLLAVRQERAGRTLAVASCRAPQQEWWFSGAGGDVDHASALVLTNPDEGPAVVDVRLHGAAGSVDDTGLRGLTLAPGETRRVALTDFAPGSPEVTVEVSATRGRVVAHVLDIDRRAGRGGREWLPATAAPTEQLMMTGVPAEADRVQLLVTNPGAEQALVEVEVLTERGAFVPLGKEQLSVDPGTIERVDLTEALEGRAAAVRLSSLAPVTGAVRSAAGGDLAYAAAAAPLHGPSGVILAGKRSALQVAAGEEPVALRLDLHADDGRRLARRALTVPPSGLVQVPAPEGAAYAVLVPRSGEAHVAATHRGPGVAGQPAAPLPTTLRRPSVTPYAGQSDS